MTAPMTAEMHATLIGDTDADGNAEFMVEGSKFKGRDDIVLSVLGNTSIRFPASSTGTFAQVYEVRGTEGPFTFRAYQKQGQNWAKLAEFTTSA